MPKRRTFLFDGLGVSTGIAIGPAYVIESQGLDIESHEVSVDEVELEVARFEEAVELAKKEVQDLGRTVAERIDSQQAAIFDAHVILLSDPMLINGTVERIRSERRNSEYLFWNLTRDIGNQLKAIGDDYFAERSNDLYDVARRVLKFLGQIKYPECGERAQGCIIVANDLGPSETAQLSRDQISGFCTNVGGPTSHTAIMAKALGIPAIVGLDYITHYVRNNDTLILDGTDGKLILHPTPEQIEQYRERAKEIERERQLLERYRNLPAETRDGLNIHLEANIEFADEIPLVLEQGAEGIGLFRTEYFFIERSNLPTEDEQEEAYAQVLNAMDGKPVVFRTLDVGGDKLAVSIPIPPEHNPFLGLRALRLCLAYPEIFRRQLRPLMRAGHGRELRILLPMISSIDEVRKAKIIIEEARAQVRRNEQKSPSSLKIGAMIEIPSAALQAEVLAQEVDFFSIGTNDLIQYSLAVDRVNKMVGHLYQETHPAVLMLIRKVVKAAEKHNIPLSVCGEMAGDPYLSLVLVGLGVRTLSMSPQLLLPVKRAIRGADAENLEGLAERLLTLSSPMEVRELLSRELHTAYRGSMELELPEIDPPSEQGA